MPLPVIANVYRAAVVWGPGDNSTVPPEAVNIHHVRTTTMSEQDICDALTDAHGQIPSVVSVIAPSFSILRVEVIKLDGSSATQVCIPASTVTGSGGAEFISQGCLVASWHTAQRGARGRGRTYFGPISENGQSGGHGGWNAVTVGSELMDYVAFVAAAGGDLVVASYAHTDAHDITSAKNDGALRTQRRRQTL